MTVPVANAEELSGLESADQEVFEPFCDSYVARSAVRALQNSGYLHKTEIDNDDFFVKIIGFKKVGIEPHPPEMTTDDKAYLYEIIENVKIPTENGKIIDAIVIAEISTSECGMATPLVILTSPEYKVLGLWESYLQFRVRRKETPKGEYSSPNPNLIK
jgi:hypothetical protein